MANNNGCFAECLSGFSGFYSTIEYVKPRDDKKQQSSARGKTLGISSIATFLVLAGLMVVPAPYVIKSPGPTHDVLGEANTQQLISIPDASTFDSTGQLRLTTVGVSGGPGYPVNFAQVLKGWLAKDSAVYPRETVYPENVSQEQIDTANQLEMTTSQEQATYAALKQLGKPITTTLTVQMAVEGSPFADSIGEGDQLLKIDGKDITSYEDLIAHMDTVSPGTEVSLTFRDASDNDKEKTVSAKTTANTGGEGSRLGLALDLNFDFSVQVDINIDKIGGPSAGMMFALGIMERLTEGDQTNGKIIAGTGTMDTSGDVGAIGGIQQKLYGAKNSGAQYFLAPDSNCDEVVGHVPDGLNVVAVSTLADAWNAVTKIGAGDASSLPTCK